MRTAVPALLGAVILLSTLSFSIHGSANASGIEIKRNLIFYIFYPGHDNWNPNGGSGYFNITGSDLTDINSSSFLVVEPDPCFGEAPYLHGFYIYCPFGPPGSTEQLRVAVFNP